MLTRIFRGMTGLRFLFLVAAVACLLVYNGCSSPNLSKKDEGSTSPKPASPPAGEHPTGAIPPVEQPAAGPPPPPPPPSRAPASEAAAPDNNCAVVRVFYATDRKPTDSKRPNKMYSGERLDNESVLLGTLDVSIPRDHKMGEIERPSILRLEFHENPEKQIVLLRITPEPAEQFFPQLSARIATSAEKQAFVFVHGYDVTFADAARRTAQLAYDLGFDGAPILYSWPSKGKVGAYPADEATIEWTTPHLKRFLEQVAAESHATTVHLIAHSMGNRAVTGALNAIATEHSGVPPMFKQVFLAAPDIDVGVFKQLAMTFPSAAARVTLYASSKDEALIASKRFHNNPRAGDTGTIITIVPGVDTIDATAVDTGLLGHSYYGDNRSILTDIYYTIHNGDPPDKRFGMRAAKNHDLIYWLFRP